MNISYNILTEKYSDEVTELLTNSFRESEPITMALGITKQDFADYIELYTRDSIQNNLSVIAFDEDKNRVAGCTINRDYFAVNPPDSYKISKSIEPMEKLIHQLSSEFRSSTPKNFGDYFYLFIGGMLPEYSGKGINYQKAVFNEKVARQNNFKYIVVEPTGPATQHIYLNKLGYEEISSIRYNEFIYGGKKIFNKIENVESCKLAIKKL